MTVHARRDEKRRFPRVPAQHILTFARMVAGASKKMIVERLRRLEAQGLVRRQVLDTAPVSVEYSITPLGETALSFLDELRKWSEGLPAELGGGD